MITRTVPESAVLSAVIDLLVWQYRGIVIRINSGAMQPVESPQIGGKGGRFVRFCHWQCLGQERLEKGVSDVLALLPGGLLIAVECKSPDRRQRNGQPASPSPEQRLFLEAVRERGGLGVVVDDIDVLIAELIKRGY